MRFAVVLVFLLLPMPVLAQSCPGPLRHARKLVLVVPGTMRSTTAPLWRFTRSDAAAPWRALGGPVMAQIGRSGTAWSPFFRRYAVAGEAVKAEGDKRLPAGIYHIGRSFGFAPSRLPHYLRITEGMTCVDDASSPAYNTIASRRDIGWAVSGENMWRVPEYRRGLMVRYPTDRAAKAGSCIFLHVRKPGVSGTSGCVSLPEADIERLQSFASEGAVIAIIPQSALDRFARCLPKPQDAMQER